jgi:hypothetical protein
VAIGNALASKRILSILRKRILCTRHQLESKISEAGPLNQRPDPVSITDGLRALEQRRHIQSAHFSSPDVDTFWLRGLPSSDPAYQSRLRMLQDAYPIYRTHANSDVHCADILELVVHESFDQSSTFDVIHSEILQGTPKAISVGTSSIDNQAPIDHLVRHGATGTLVLVEDKNVRDWFYPDSRIDDIARIIAKSVSNQLTPFLVTRKVPYVSHLLFARIGILAFQTHHQYFHPDLSDAMAVVKHTDGLGFHDILFTMNANPNFVRYLDGLKGDVLVKYRETFLSQQDLMRAFAIERSIGWYEFLKELHMPWTRIEHEAYDYEDYTP